MAAGEAGHAGQRGEGWRTVPTDQPAQPSNPVGPAGSRFTFRPLRESDLEAVLAIERRVFNTPWDESAFRAFLDPGPAFSRVALDGERVTGYALGWCAVGEAQLMNLAVDPPWRGLSLGSSLVRWTLETCARRGAVVVFLEVRASNEGALRLYRRHGFEVCGRRRNYYRKPREDALVLRAALGAAATPRGPEHGGGDRPAD